MILNSKATHVLYTWNIYIYFFTYTHFLSVYYISVQCILIRLGMCFKKATLKLPRTNGHVWRYCYDYTRQSSVASGDSRSLPTPVGDRIDGMYVCKFTTWGSLCDHTKPTRRGLYLFLTLWTNLSNPVRNLNFLRYSSLPLCAGSKFWARLVAMRKLYRLSDLYLSESLHKRCPN